MELSYTQNKLEFNKVSFKDELKDKLGTVCSNCGSNIGIEYHHVVPLALGGTNNIGNIVPLCHVCHQIAHGSRNIRDIKKPENTGRPRKPPVPGYLKILEEYKKGKIGRKECEKQLQLTQGSKLTDMWFYKKYLKDNRIKVLKNRIDMLNTPKCLKMDHSQEFVARVVYEDGKEEKFFACG